MWRDVFEDFQRGIIDTRASCVIVRFPFQFHDYASYKLAAWLLWVQSERTTGKLIKWVYKRKKALEYAELINICWSTASLQEISVPKKPRALMKLMNVYKLKAVGGLKATQKT